MEAKKSKSSSSPPLSHLFFEAATNTKFESREQQQVNSQSASDIDRPASQPLQRDNSSSRNYSTSESDSSVSSTSSTIQPHQYPVTCVEYFKILLEDSEDRFAEASNFLYRTSTYSFMFEFHIRILSDLCDELANVPPNVAAEDYENALILRQRLLRLQQHLVGRRNLMLGHYGDESENDDIRPPVGAEIYLGAAADAKAARQRRFQMLVLIRTIADLKMKEETCRQRRLEAQAELNRYFDLLKQPGIGDEVQKDEKLGSAAEIASVDSETNNKDDDSSSMSQVEQDRNEPESSSATSRARSHSSNDPDALGGKETSSNGSDTKSFSSSQVGRDHDEPSSTSPTRTDSSNDRYCILWMESAETEKSAANKMMPPFIQLKSSGACVFCHELHWSHLCLKISTLESRQRFYRIYGMCFVCGRTHTGACTDTKRVCKWPQCGAINEHHAALCPNVNYPVTAEVVQAEERRINNLNRTNNRPRGCGWCG